MNVHKLRYSSFMRMEYKHEKKKAMAKKTNNHKVYGGGT